MQIANPIYDVVFKFLMQDKDIAREFLSVLLDIDIVQLDFKPQEIIRETSDDSIRLFRMDFKAVIQTAEGERKNILIELQKAKHLFDVMRFRRYLGDNYRKEELVTIEKNKQVSLPLPIMTVYLLGFKLQNVKIPVLKVNRVYRNAVNGEELEVKEEFVEQLTHDSIVVQIPRLKTDMQTRLEKILQIFNQTFKSTDNGHVLNYAGDESDPLLKKMLQVLLRAIATEDVRNQMDEEDSWDRILDRELAEKNAEIEKKNRLLKKSRAAVKTERQKAEAERQKAEAERQKAEAERQRSIAAALRMHAAGISDSEICILLDISQEELSNWLKQN